MKKWIKKNQLLRSLKNDNKKAFMIIGKNSFVNNRFKNELVQRRKIWARIINGKVQIIKVKRGCLRVGYAVEWNSKKRYDELIINLGIFEKNSANEFIGIEKYFLFREYSDWKWQNIEEIIQLTNDSLNLVLQQDKAPNLISNFDLYKTKVENLTNEDLI